MRQFSVRWWVENPLARYEAAMAEIQRQREQRALGLLLPREYTPGHGLHCHCPGCEFMLNGEKAYDKFGPPPFIGTFEHATGDVARDYNRFAIVDGEEVYCTRIWAGNRWWPHDEALDYGKIWQKRMPPLPAPETQASRAYRQERS